MPNLFKRLFVLIAVLAAGHFAVAQEMAAEQIGHDSSGHTFKSKVYLSHNKVRIESESDKSIMLLDLDAGTSVVLDPERKTYMEQPAGMTRQNVTAFKTADNTPCVRNPNSKGTGTCTQVGTEMINGRKADKWEIIQPMGGQTVTAHVWLDTQWHFRVKQEVAGMTGEMQNIKEGPQPAAIFEIPSDYQKMTIQDKYKK